MAVQLARSIAVEVTGVCTARNLKLVRSVGACHVIDYTQDQIGRCGARYA